METAARYGNCNRCGRALKDERSVVRGMGPVCARKALSENGVQEEKTNIEYLPVPLDDGIVLTRGGSGGVRTNIPHLVTYHSPTGWEWGYGGSGPADLALNIVEVLLHRLGHKGEKTKLSDGAVCFAMAWRLHQDFKRDFIATLPEQGGTIPLEAAVGWIKERE